MWNGHENADDVAGRVTGPNPGADARSCKYGTPGKITDKKGKSLPESGKGEPLEVPQSPKKEPVSCLTDWHYSHWLPFVVTHSRYATMLLGVVAIEGDDLLYFGGFAHQTQLTVGVLHQWQRITRRLSIRVVT